MHKNNMKLNFFINKYIVYYIVSLVAGVLITLLLYNFIGIDENNKILSKDMLIAIKNYNIDIIEFGKKILIIRFIELVIIYICLHTKIKVLIYNVIIMYLGVKSGLVLSVFILEMKFVGIINYILITFPQYYIYIYGLFKLYEKSIVYISKRKNTYKLKEILRKIFDISYLTCIWLLAIGAEIIIKNLLVKKCFIII